ncbi:nitroreductase family protein [Clostridium manihotivorum]|uniref:Nitroreductase n=1 Tax=Clostridium manihotivorum TaxID=2320868 RepID=A0A3R5U769_9CLOT|nr:nitroreductase family protein [Clostridium manihotivorum]QAA30535.1 nitroreductase [Clostridium manihotivorum]
MNNAKFYETIFKRKSVRKYDMAPLDEKTLEDVKKFIDDIKPLLPEVNTEFQVISQDDVKSFMSIKAPHYVVVFSENKEGYLTNIGYMLQQLDLYLSSKGLGACWQGIAKPAKDIINKSNLEFVIMLAFGKPAENLHRSDKSEFKRNSMESIRDKGDFDELLEVVRIAPSATNSQPWYFNIEGNSLHVDCIKLNPIKALIMERMNKVDMGIALCHLDIACQKSEKKFKFSLKEPSNYNAPKGYYNIGLVEIE